MSGHWPKRARNITTSDALISLEPHRLQGANRRYPACEATGVGLWGGLLGGGLAAGEGDVEGD